MKKILILFILGTIIYLSGCKLGPDFQKPDYNSPETFRFDSTATDTVVNLYWWKLFDDPVLDTLIATALRENKDVLVAAARIESARANIGYTNADQWPTLNYNAGAGSGNYAGVKQSSSTNNFFAYPELSWEIGFWGKYRRLNEVSQADLLASEYGMRTIQMSLISSVASTYFELLSNKAKMLISENTLASRDSGLLIIEERYHWGVVAEIDLNQSQVQRAISAAAVPQYRRAIAQTESSLSILLGNNPEAIATTSKLINMAFPPDIPTGLPSQLLERRPDIKQAEFLLQAQNAQIGVAEAMRWPSLSLTGLLGVASTDLSSLTTGGLAWSASASLLGPLFEFGKNKKRAEMARFETKALLYDYESSVLQAFKEVEDALISIETLREELVAQQMRYKAATNAEMLSDKRYLLGETSYLEVLDSQRQSFNAQLDFTQTRLNLLTTYIELYKALGGGWLSPDEEQAATDAADAAAQQK
jgi:multidrug efflux system outer membrane protein